MIYTEGHRFYNFLQLSTCEEGYSSGTILYYFSYFVVLGINPRAYLLQQYSPVLAPHLVCLIGDLLLVFTLALNSQSSCPSLQSTVRLTVPLYLPKFSIFYEQKSHKFWTIQALRHFPIETILQPYPLAKIFSVSSSSGWATILFALILVLWIYIYYIII